MNFSTALRRWIGWGVIFAALGACAKPQPAEVLARAGQITITVGELQESLRRGKDNYDPKSLSSSGAFLKIKQRLLDELIDRRLLVKEAERQGVTVSEDELDTEVRKFKSRYTELTFQRMLQERQVNYQAWLELRRENLLVAKFFKENLFGKIAISDADVQKYYQDHPQDFQAPEAVRVRQIVTDTKEKAEAILRRLRNGENFAKLARELSLSPDRKQGGDLGFIPRGSFPREFEVCFTMNPGEISPIIPSLYGFHIFKVLEKVPAHTIPLEEARAKISLQLTQMAQESVSKDLLKNLRQQSPVTVDEKLLKRMSL